MLDWDVQISASLRKSVLGSDEGEVLPLIFHREKPTIDSGISVRTIVNVFDDVSYAVEFTSVEFLDSFDIFEISIESQSVYKGRTDTARHYFKRQVNCATENKKIFLNSLGLVYLVAEMIPKRLSSFTPIIFLSALQGERRVRTFTASMKKSARRVHCFTEIM